MIHLVRVAILPDSAFSILRVCSVSDNVFFHSKLSVSMHKTAQKSASDCVLDGCYNNVHLEFGSDTTFTTPIIFIEL